VFRPSEHLAAQRALVGFFPAVYPGVPGEVADAGKPLVADGALERFLARMAAVVYRQCRRAAETFPALRAQVLHLVRPGPGPARPVRGVRRLVAQQSSLGDEALAADRALVRLHSGVRPGVDDEVPAARESLVAQRTRERPGFPVLGVPQRDVVRLYVRVRCTFTQYKNYVTINLVNIQCRSKKLGHFLQLITLRRLVIERCAICQVCKFCLQKKCKTYMPVHLNILC